jgi:hypothetical protein
MYIFATFNYFSISSARPISRFVIASTSNGVMGVLKVLPTAARIGSSLFAPLAPFSDAIGESVEKVVADFTQH